MYSFDIVAKYCQGEMTPDEKVAFEKELATSRELQKEVALFGDVKKAFQIKALQDAIQVERDKFRTDNGLPPRVDSIANTKPSLLRWFLIALVGLATIITAYILLKDSNNKNHQELFAANAVPPTASGQMSGTTNPIDIAYKQGDIAALEAIVSKEPTNYLGVNRLAWALLNANQPEKAISHLEQYKGKFEGKNEAELDWIAAMAHLKLNHKADAKAFLQRVAESGEALDGKAKALLKEAYFN